MASGSVWDEFLNPKSMLTPGVAGGLTMLMTNSLTSQFGLLPNYTGLALSFLFGLLVFQTTVQLPWPKLAAYYVVNSLIIFSVAIGTNHAGVETARVANRPTAAKEVAPKAADWAPGRAFFANWFDGTVKQRQELLADVKKHVDEKQAKAALAALEVPMSAAVPAKSLLTWCLEGARTSDDVAKVDAALTESKQAAMHAAPAE